MEERLGAWEGIQNLRLGWTGVCLGRKDGLPAWDGTSCCAFGTSESSWADDRELMVAVTTMQIASDFHIIGNQCSLLLERILRSRYETRELSNSSLTMNRIPRLRYNFG